MKIPQDLHIHTTFSYGDHAVVPEQTVPFIAAVAHADILGISDHIEYLEDDNFTSYSDIVKSHGLYLGVEVSSSSWISRATELEVDYYIYHCADRVTEYQAAEKLLMTNKPVIIAHPLMMKTDLRKVPKECYLEINNRYVWRYDWQKGLLPFVSRFKFVIGSDAHQPNWLNQTVARYVAQELGVEEGLLF